MISIKNYIYKKLINKIIKLYIILLSVTYLIFAVNVFFEGRHITNSIDGTVKNIVSQAILDQDYLFAQRRIIEFTNSLSKSFNTKLNYEIYLDDKLLARWNSFDRDHLKLNFHKKSDLWSSKILRTHYSFDIVHAIFKFHKYFIPILVLLVLITMYFHKKFMSSVQLLINDIEKTKNLTNKMKAIIDEDEMPAIKEKLQISELSELKDQLFDLIAHTFKMKSKVKELARKESMHLLSTQVAHDIRSPLATLETVSDDIEQLPIKSKHLLRNSIKRIQDISNNLLNESKEKKEDNQEGIFKILPVIEELIEEKNLEYREKTNIRINCNLDRAGNGLVKIHPSELKTILSNLMNNSVEAIGKNEGDITIELSIDNYIEISVNDNGPGISNEILSQLGEKGFSFGKSKSKTSGSGLGIYGAKEILKKYDADLFIQSKNGTQIKLRIPNLNYMDQDKNQSAEKFKPNEKVKIQSPDFALLDDDALVRMTWKMSVESKGKTIHVFQAPDDLLKSIQYYDNNTSFYIDSDLGDCAHKGEEIAQTLYEKGFFNIYMTTGYEKEKFKDMSFIKDVRDKSAPI